jgi:tRNA threonylcarbamoyladenosine biosynthesis protein TsaB
MRVLAIDTSTLTASVAVVVDGVVVAASEARTGAHSERLMPLVAEVTGRAGVAPRSLDAVAVGAGPGSFTGLRIGMATAKGIAFAAGVPLWLVSSLAALAHGVPGLAVGALDARRGEVYAGFYRDGVAVAAERVVPPAELAAAIAAIRGEREPVTVVGDIPGADHTRTPSAAAVGLLALAGDRVDALAGGAPAYLRPAEAEVKYPHGVPGALRRRPGEAP